MKGGIYMAIFYLYIRRILIFIIITSSLVCFVKESYVAAETIDLNMYSGSYALTDGDNDRLLVGKDADKPMANASTTKILTCILVLEKCDLSDEVTISSKVESQPKVRLGMKEGEVYPLKDLLYGLMLESYNDCAVAIAEHIAGTTENFAKMLNEKAKEIGCKDTYFITPNGLDEEDENGFHHTTANDLCRMMSYCAWESSKSLLFLEITQTRNYSGTSNGKKYMFTNRNSFLNQMEGVLTGKTGFTNKAGYCYVAAMEQNGERYCIALLACGWPNNKNYKWQDAKTLFEYGLSNYDKKRVRINRIEKQITLDGHIGNSDFININQGSKITVGTDRKVYDLLLNNDEKIVVDIIVYKNINLPIEEGKVVGICNLYIDNQLFDSIALKTKENIYIWGWEDLFSTIFYHFLTFSL